jgi:hypothetical protein
MTSYSEIIKMIKTPLTIKHDVGVPGHTMFKCYCFLKDGKVAINCPSLHRRGHQVASAIITPHSHKGTPFLHYCRNLCIVLLYSRGLSLARDMWFMFTHQRRLGHAGA